MPKLKDRILKIASNVFKAHTKLAELTLEQSNLKKELKQDWKLYLGKTLTNRQLDKIVKDFQENEQDIFLSNPSYRHITLPVLKNYIDLTTQQIQEKRLLKAQTQNFLELGDEKELRRYKRLLNEQRKFKRLQNKIKVGTSQDSEVLSDLAESLALPLLRDLPRNLSLKMKNDIIEKELKIRKENYKKIFGTQRSYFLFLKDILSVGRFIPPSEQAQLDMIEQTDDMLEKSVRMAEYIQRKTGKTYEQVQDFLLEKEKPTEYTKDKLRAYQFYFNKKYRRNETDYHIELPPDIQKKRADEIFKKESKLRTQKIRDKINLEGINALPRAYQKAVEIGKWTEQEAIRNYSRNLLIQKGKSPEQKYIQQIERWTKQFEKIRERKLEKELIKTRLPVFKNVHTLRVSPQQFKRQELLKIIAKTFGTGSNPYVRFLNAYYTLKKRKERLKKKNETR